MRKRRLEPVEFSTGCFQVSSATRNSEVYGLYIATFDPSQSVVAPNPEDEVEDVVGDTS